MGIIDTRIFKSGNSMAVRLPKELGFEEGMAVQIERDGTGVTVRPTVDADAERRKVEAFVAEMLALGPVGVVGPREPIDIPDRAGL
jgi:antitoxin VapB